MIFNKVIVFGVIFSVVECAPAGKRRDAAFDPEQLMSRYMNMRTNQGLFGSYHPNDLVNSIVEYFSHGGPQTTNNNQWGLAVYNPNGKIGQYIGNMNSPGNLGPEPTDGVSKDGNVKAAEGSAFNPNTLNERLMQNALSRGNLFSNFASPAAQATANGQDNVGFDADALNRQMMEITMNKLKTNGESIQETTTQETGNDTNDKTGPNVAQEPAGQMLGFNPDTLNAGLLKSLSSHGPVNGGSSGGTTVQSYTRAMVLGFNPDTLNAGLINSIGYNPDSAIGNIPTYKGNDAMFGEMVHGAVSKDSHLGGTTGHDNSSGSSALGGMIAVDGGTALNKNGGQPGSHSSVAVAGDGNTAEQSIQNGQGSLTSVYGGNQSGASPSSGGTVGSFSAGDMGPQRYGNKNSGSPPGVSAGTALHQTESATSKVHGIGGMG